MRKIRTAILVNSRIRHNRRGIQNAIRPVMNQAMKYHIFYSTLFLLICGCTTVEFVRKDFTPRRQAVVRFTPPSNPRREADYRTELAKQATNFCGGAYEITKEYQAREETGTAAGVGTGFGIGTSGSIFVGGSDRSTAMYNFVEFFCK